MKTAQPLHLTHPYLALCERSIVVTEAERLAVGELRIVEDSLAPGDVPGWTGDRPSRSFLVLEGLLGTSKTLRDGSVQITAFHVPGDLLGLTSLHLETLDSDIAALAPSTVAFVENSDLRRLCEEHPRIAALLWRTTLVETAVAREWIVNVAQRQALSRLAHLLCEMMTRMEAAGLAADGSCSLPLTQVDLSEATGLSNVHINRMLQELRRRELIAFGQGTLTIHDWDALAGLGGFQADYLHVREPGLTA